jgi:cell division protein FtsL
MLKLANFTLVIATLITASVLYSLEHITRGHERTIARANAELVDNSEAIKLLKAEWSSLTRLERVQKLAEQTLAMKVVEPDQFVTEGELAPRLKAIAPEQAPGGQGSIDDLLKKMQ